MKLFIRPCEALHMSSRRSPYVLMKLFICPYGALHMSLRNSPYVLMKLSTCPYEALHMSFGLSKCHFSSLNVIWAPVCPFRATPWIQKKSCSVPLNNCYNLQQVLRHCNPSAHLPTASDGPPQLCSSA